ncbi:MAG TPA: SCO family protein [Candidatus Acidoferrum sp.]|nr:SCO family protein [Candidatus Acidoferrum sp.]
MRSLLGIVGALALLLAAVTQAEAAYPVHAVVLSSGPGLVVARTRGATGLLAAGIYRFAVDKRQPPLASGSDIDGLVDGRRGAMLRLDDVAAAAPFVPGLPGALRVRAVRTGDALPAISLVDQDGRRVNLGQWRGKTVVLSFVYTRCPLTNVCPAVSGKFSYLQRHIDPATTHLAVVTLDPEFDSPSVLKRYGVAYETDAQRWSLLTGEGHNVGALLDAFSISPLQDGPGDFIHDEALVIADAGGTVREIIPSPGWDPNDVLAEVRAVQGERANPLRRFMLAAVAGIASLCGGYSFAAVAVELAAIGITFFGCGALLLWVIWRMFLNERPQWRRRT